MEAAKQAISKITSRSGHTTEVEERVNKPVISETVKPTRHEEITQAVDREVHQHHHHTTVQPLSHKEVLPEKHTHNQLPTEHREFHHGNESETRERLEQEAAKFKNTTRTHETQHTQAAVGAVEGEHVHHHVHEVVQPVIHKETIQPQVVHTTVPIHEVHHNDAQHHGTSFLPMKDISEFGTPGQGVRHEKYEGCPRQYNESMQQSQTEDDKLMKNGHNGSHSHHNGGILSSDKTDRETNTNGSRNGSLDSGVGLGTNEVSKTTNGINKTTSGVVGKTTNGVVGKKPSLMDKINPKVDSTGDGIAGFMK